MKKFLRIFLFSLMICVVVAALAACAGNHQHSFTERWSTNATHHWHAGNCEHTQQIADMGEHTWTTEGTVTLKPGCTTNGKNTYTCTVCGMTKSDLIQPTGHTYTDASWGYAAVNGALYLEKRCDVCNEIAEQNAVSNSAVAIDQDDAQYWLDYAEDGFILYLLPDVDYGTLYIRTTIDHRAVNVDNWADGNNMYFRSISGLTILGADGAMLDAIVIEAGTYTTGGAQHSASYINPNHKSFIALEDLTISNLTFSGETTPLRLEGQLAIDGLTVDGCSMDTHNDIHFLVMAGESGAEYFDLIANEALMTVSYKNITVINCTISGVETAIELCGTENVTVSGNTFADVGAYVILMNGNTAYTGTVTVTDNAVDGCGNRFLLADNVTADLVVTGNTVANYIGTNTDIVNVTNMTGNATVADNDWGDEAFTETIEAPAV